jgi:hypothetical protein
MALFEGLGILRVAEEGFLESSGTCFGNIVIGLLLSKRNFRFWVL